jgi:hypothetical protein
MLDDFLSCFLLILASCMPAGELALDRTLLPFSHRSGVVAAIELSVEERARPRPLKEDREDCEPDSNSPGAAECEAWERGSRGARREGGGFLSLWPCGCSGGERRLGCVGLPFAPRSPACQEGGEVKGASIFGSSGGDASTLVSSPRGDCTG